METYMILLRAVMPTGKNKVPMAQLRVTLEKAGLKNVRTISRVAMLSSNQA